MKTAITISLVIVAVIWVLAVTSKTRLYASVEVPVAVAVASVTAVVIGRRYLARDRAARFGTLGTVALIAVVWGVVFGLAYAILYAATQVGVV